MRRVDWAEAQRLLLPERPAALRLAARILGQRQLAEDAVQEALIRAALALGTLREPGAVGPWFRRIVEREALRLCGGREAPAADLAPAGWDPAADEGVVAEAEREQARRALASLSPPLRAAVALHGGLGLPVAETAAVLGVPLGTVKSRCAAARALLRRRMDRPLAEVLAMAGTGLRLMPWAEMDEDNRKWAAGGGPPAVEVPEEEVRARFPEVSWPAAAATGLSFSAARLLDDGAVRMGWAWYGDDAAGLMVSLGATPAGWQTHLRDESGEAVQTPTRVAGRDVTWVARPDGVHYVLGERSGITVVLGGRLPAGHLRALAEAILA
jgi:RNA polymerase sigma-70 factor (ECF subfamily)